MAQMDKNGSRILTGLIILAAVTFGVRFNEMIKKFVNAGSIHAYAASENEQALNLLQTAAGDAAVSKEIKPAEKTMAETKSKNSAPPKDPAEATTTPPSKTQKPVIEAPSLGDAPSAKSKDNWKAADDLDDQYSDVKMELFSDLSKRRKDLDAKEKELFMREALLKAAQAEITQKTDELTKIKTDIEGLLKQQTDQENKRILSLVRIYEGMKPVDAARIFDALDTDILLQVMTKMSERKSAPILAAMDSDKARHLTILLAEQNKLPDLPALSVAQ